MVATPIGIGTSGQIAKLIGFVMVAELQNSCTSDIADACGRLDVGGLIARVIPEHLHKWDVDRVLVRRQHVRQCPVRRVPDSEQASGHWALFAQFVSARDHHTLDDDVKIFSVLTNAMLDAGIAASDAKRAYDSVRPVTAIPLVFRGKKIKAWGGPEKGTVEMDGSQWIPYQPATFPTPPSPDYVSGHSTYSATAARILALWTGSDRFDYSVTLPAGSSKIEPGVTPMHSVVLHWDTFSQAADQAGMSRRYGGIHFRAADLMGRLLGRLVAFEAWVKAEAYFDRKIVSVESAYSLH